MITSFERMWGSKSSLEENDRVLYPTLQHLQTLESKANQDTRVILPSTLTHSRHDPRPTGHVSPMNPPTSTSRTSLASRGGDHLVDADRRERENPVFTLNPGSGGLRRLSRVRGWGLFKAPSGGRWSREKCSERVTVMLNVEKVRSRDRGDGEGRER